MMVFQICFLFQPIVSTIDFKQEINKYKVSAWNSKGVYVIKYFNHEMGLKFNSSSLFAEKNIYVTKIINVLITYDLDNWEINSLGNFALKNFWFGATNIVKNSENNHYLILIISKKNLVFLCSEKDQLMALLIALVQQRKSLVLILV